MRAFALLLAFGLALGFGPVASAQPNFTRLVKEEGRAVVNVSAAYQALPQFPAPPAPDVPMDEDLLDLLRRYAEPDEPQAYPLGSGFLISEDGYIVTNAHVVSSAGRYEILVRLADRREFEAQVVGFDLPSDIALIKIDGRGLPRVRIGKPDRLQPGEWVAAIGSPFGFERSVTAGIVSGKGRYLPGESYVPFIQTDVAVNPGNSGGPLFNLRGEVIGVNSVIMSRSGGYMGLSFAIPIDVAMDVIAQLRASGKVVRGRIGVRLQEVTTDLARALQLAAPAGALVSEVEADSPAEHAGLRAGDVIVDFGGRSIESPGDVLQHAAATKPGDIVRLRVMRKGVAYAAALTVDEPRQAPFLRVPLPRTDTTDLARFGLRVAPLSAEERERLNIKGGVAVQRAEGPAQRAGLQRGDVILSVNGEETATLDAFRSRLAQSLPGGTAALLVQRGGMRQFLALRLPPGV